MSQQNRTSTQHWFYEEWVKGFRKPPADLRDAAVAEAAKANDRIRKICAEKLPVGSGNDRLFPTDLAVK